MPSASKKIYWADKQAYFPGFWCSNSTKPAFFSQAAVIRASCFAVQWQLWIKFQLIYYKFRLLIRRLNYCKLFVPGRFILRRPFCAGCWKQTVSFTLLIFLLNPCWLQSRIESIFHRRVKPFIIFIVSNVFKAAGTTAIFPRRLDWYI